MVRPKQKKEILTYTVVTSALNALYGSKFTESVFES